MIVKIAIQNTYSKQHAGTANGWTSPGETFRRGTTEVAALPANRRKLGC